MTSLENIMCATPVVIFDNGGTVDFVDHKINGYIAKYKSSEDLAEGILYCLKMSCSSLSLKDSFLSNNILKEHKKFINNIS
jgi:glycosyltransferase involved in cell wall biosynthesis